MTIKEVIPQAEEDSEEEVDEEEAATMAPLVEPCPCSSAMATVKHEMQDWLEESGSEDEEEEEEEAKGGDDEEEGESKEESEEVSSLILGQKGCWMPRPALGPQIHHWHARSDLFHCVSWCFGQ
ncbi:kelch domain-containing protein 4-like [Carassius auratus]|uniref:Kelch domain-containing protein 4-like n=1 Tax=Carassius auratus TaxID=7957 RepID=A0A6P6MDJ6_CARAU|nr:kelch domain-containing protein 4-like [Carassius auratus]